MVVAAEIASDNKFNLTLQVIPNEIWPKILIFQVYPPGFDIYSHSKGNK